MLVDFWATWCAPCLAEMPHLAKAYESYRDQGLEIVGVSLDTAAADRVKRVVKDRKMVWPQILRGGTEIAATYNVTALPTAFLVDGDTGSVLARGDELRGEELLKTIERHLKSKKD